jgi:cell pole-organizing protein PopZ
VAHNSEASVEEILDSIKKVIARDNRSDALEAQRRRAESRDTTDSPTRPHIADDDEDEILDLGELDVDPMEDDQDADDAERAECDPGEPLITAAARGAVQENLAALAMLAQPGARPQIVRSGETSLEGLTRELLRPMLAEWLDKNLPGMVESMVQAEIARIAGKRG